MKSLLSVSVFTQETTQRLASPSIEVTTKMLSSRMKPFSSTCTRTGSSFLRLSSSKMTPSLVLSGSTRGTAAAAAAAAAAASSRVSFLSKKASSSLQATPRFYTTSSELKSPVTAARGMSSISLDADADADATASSNNNTGSTSTGSNTSSPPGKNPIPDFNDAKAAFESKSTRQLVTALITFEMCQLPILVRNAEKMLKFSRNVLGDRIIDATLKATLFGHFCAGENETKIQPVIKQLEQAGIGR